MYLQASVIPSKWQMCSYLQNEIIFVLGAHFSKQKQDGRGKTSRRLGDETLNVQIHVRFKSIERFQLSSPCGCVVRPDGGVEIEFNLLSRSVALLLRLIKGLSRGQPL